MMTSHMNPCCCEVTMTSFIHSHLIDHQSEQHYVTFLKLNNSFRVMLVVQSLVIV